MTEFDITSILRGLDSEDVDSLRRVMNAIIHCLAGVAPATAAEISDLEISEHASMIWMTESARNNGLLERMITRFGSARYGNSNTVREAARELDLVVTEAVMNPEARPYRELVIAEGFFDQLVANGRATYGLGADNEYGDIEPDSDDEKRYKKDKNSTRKRTRSSNAATSNKRPRMGVSWSEDEAFGDEGSSDDVNGEEDKDDNNNDIKHPVGRGSNPANKKHSAKRKYGERCIPDENIDRDKAVTGRPDQSKLHIELKTERPDPASPDRFIPCSPITFDYPHMVNWDDKISVSKLNGWRLQVYKRTLGSKRVSRPPWTVAEQNKLLELVSSHLKAPATGGRYSQIKWDKIEVQFNTHFVGKTHKKGEKMAETKYNVRGKNMVAKSRKLAQTRSHIPRSAGAIENQLTHFTHPLALKLVAAARKADEGGDGEESDESDDPPQKGKGKGKGKGNASAERERAR